MQPDRWLKELSFWLRSLLHRRELDRELDDEISYHIEAKTEENIAQGMTREAAQRAARIELGGVEQLKEKLRSLRTGAWLDTFFQDIRFGLRMLRKSPGFTIIAILTLALGIGATTAIFTLVYSTVLGELPFPRAERIIRVYDSRLSGESIGGLVGAPRFFDLQARSRALENVGFYYFDKPTLTAGTNLPESVKAAGVNADFWNVLGVQPFLGRTFNAADDKPNAPLAIVLSYQAWQRLLDGDLQVIGRQVMLDQRAATVVGVMPQTFEVPANIDLWRVAQYEAGSFGSYRGEGSHFFNVIARMRPGVTLQTARGDLDRIGEQLQRQYPQTDGKWRFTCESLRDAWFGGIRAALLAMMAAALLLLLIACMNVANLLLSRATTREREVAVRRALGASRARVAMQFLAESALLSLVGGAAGVLAALVLVHGIAARLPGRLGVPGAVEMNWPVLGFAFFLSLATGVGFGLTPALQKSNVPLNTVLKQGEERLGGAAGAALRNVLSATQVGLSLVLLIGASLLGQTVWNLLKSPLGFKPDHILTFSLKLPWNSKPAEIRNFYAEVQRRVAAVPGVAAAGQTDAPPAVEWHLRSNFDADWLPRIPNQPAINAEDRSMAGDFLVVMGMRLLAGRAFTAQDQMSDVPPVIVNEALVHEYLRGGNAVGRHLIVNGQEHEIVGVLANVRGTAGSIAKPPGPEVYWPADANGGVVLRYFVLKSAVPAAQTIHAIREQVHQIDPRQAIGNVQTMDDLLNQAVAQPRLNMMVLASFAVVALLLACIGIYGVISYAVSRRTHEIGVRMALGARRGDVRWMVLGQGARLALAGIAMGLGGGLGLTRFLRSMLFGVTPTDPATFAVVTLLLFATALAASYLPARRAMRVDPVSAMRCE